MPYVKTKFNSAKFEKTMFNVVDYSIGFLDGTKMGQTKFLSNLAKGTIEAFKNYVDVNARMSPGALHHIYEWNQVGSPAARLYDVNYAVSTSGTIFFNSQFRQSNSIKNGSTVPFYNKAQVMEAGQAVVIRPRNSKVLAFEDNGEQVFTPNPVKVDTPGGSEVQGAYQNVFNSFFNRYFTQSFLRASGLLDYLQNPTAYKRNFAAGSRQGRSKGIQTGFNWIVNATIEVE